jgi:hypothetical protein
MSQFAEHVPAVHFQHPRRAAWLAVALVAIAIAAATVIVLVSNGNDSSTSSATPVTAPAGGVNEDFRGASAAGAIGAPVTLQSTRGPDETLRGQAASSAASR